MRLFINKEQWDELWYTLKRNKKRSLVTSLGVFAGMFFFTVLTSLGNGMGNSVDSLLASVSNEAIFFLPGRTTLPYQGYQDNRQISITYRDYLAAQQLPCVQRVDYTMNFQADTEQDWSNTLVQANHISRYVTVMGVSEGYFQEITKIAVIYGRDFSSEEYQSHDAICLIGEERAKRFFKDPSKALGQIITIAGIPVKVVGVIRSMTDSFQMGFNIDWSIVVPAPVAMKNNLDKPIMLVVTPRQGFTIDEAKAETLNLLTYRHHVHPADERAISTISLDVVTSLFSMIGKGITWLIWIVGIGTLITGVIGVSNILLVTVRERQREIGVRRAIGAKPASIRAQFMSEAIVMILLAGSVGILLGMLVSIGIGFIAEHPPVNEFLLRPYPTPQGLLLSLAIMLVGGIFAGLLPVYKALQVKAIDAIRDE